MLCETIGGELRNYTGDKGEPRSYAELHFICPARGDGARGLKGRSIKCSKAEAELFFSKGRAVYEIESEIRQGQNGAYEKLIQFRYAGPLENFQQLQTGELAYKADTTANQGARKTA